MTASIRRRIPLVAASAVLLGGLPAASSAATFITGPADPDYTTLFQGASAKTFGDLGFTVGTGAGELHVSTGTWTDPAGLFFGTTYAGNLTATGQTTGKLSYAYSVFSIPTALDARDYAWGQNYGSNASTDPALDTPWQGSIWDLGGPANQAVVFPVVDHGPLPNEALEYTVYLTDTPNSTNLADWHLAKLSAVYMQGWEADHISLADGFTTVWTLDDPKATFRYVSVQGVGSQALRPLSDTEDEIDAVAGLTAGGGSVRPPVPEPETYALMLAGLGVLGAVGRRRKQRAG